MKISNEQKLETRRKLVNSATELFVLNGYEKTSMKAIAKNAGVGDATIYKYFPNKDKLILGFYEVRGTDAITSYRDTADVNTYSFAEKLQLLTDTYLEQLLADREFVELSIQSFFKSPITLLKDELKVAKDYRSEFSQLLEALDQEEDTVEIPMKSTIAALLTDYLFAITLYWMKDDSEEFSNTSQLTDLSIQVIDALLRSGIINKSIEMISFAVKTHIIRGLSTGNGILSLLEDVRKLSGHATKMGGAV